ncbi:hypothetical protein BDW72DRAFT_188451, partial [Aspergillus terricola var. indicus]
ILSLLLIQISCNWMTFLNSQAKQVILQPPFLITLSCLYNTVILYMHWNYFIILGSIFKSTGSCLTIT